MNQSLNDEELKVVEVLKKYNQLKHDDLKEYLGYNATGRYFIDMLRRLAQRGYIKSVQGLGHLYWRWDIPITSISKAQYKKAIVVINTYVKQLELSENNDNAIEGIKEISLKNATLDPKGEYTLYQYTIETRLLNVLIYYYRTYHNLSNNELHELTSNMLPPVFIERFAAIKDVGTKTLRLLEKFSLVSGIELRY